MLIEPYNPDIFIIHAAAASLSHDMGLYMTHCNDFGGTAELAAALDDHVTDPARIKAAWSKELFDAYCRRWLDFVGVHCGFAGFGL